MVENIEVVPNCTATEVFDMTQGWTAMELCALKSCLLEERNLAPLVDRIGLHIMEWFNVAKEAGTSITMEEAVSKQVADKR